ncbi:MarR family transcriptional regulator (plasmid) [Sinorhizobium meliloti]|uniref:MarR family winged helix-turn-helix transcriptional regulator n=1 Tax=Sinorhizobium TaxID=28105 RepID=UPI000FD87982|nr:MULTISPECIES: MarR family transcriptional regulator [Sinorhizobium]MDW9359033.1 MarR family transcriptional regulator [Sinorhizobium meliloti]MDW9418509.1 MarR family transcriptional regulator [Sinorhizobium meliloti]MDW9464279.1 MarR family transcriptional regulator [Sinorhizobium meliloti]MDW9514628.1 MarR family transcriptional regulator [Sinorhizobium meliloti]MDW9621864.1 MarR family transcriptional regulator [Sinorhizobium meliloti]
MPRSRRGAPALNDDVYFGLAGFRLAVRRFLLFSEAALGEHGVTSQQYQALLVIRTAPRLQVRLRDLAEQMLMHHNGAVQLVDRMASNGLVERLPAEDDKRSVMIVMTPQGRDLLGTLARVHLEGMRANEPLLANSLKRLRQVRRLLSFVV